VTDVRKLRRLQRGATTTEYIILIAVLVVLAILILINLRGRVGSMGATSQSAFQQAQTSSQQATR